MSSFDQDKLKVIQPPSISKSPECITPSAFDTKSRQQSAKVGIFNLISTMIGGGALSLPFAISRCGLILGFSLLIISALLSIFSFDILIATSRRTGAMTYQQIGYFAFGKKLSLFVTFMIWFNCYIASIAYCVLIGDLIKPVILYIFNISSDENMESLRRLIIAISIICVSPFCYMRQIGALKYTSIISITSVIILTIIITSKTLINFNSEHMIYYIDNGESHSFMINTEIKLWPNKWDDVIYVFPVFGISFLCHFNIPQVHSELTRPTRKRMRKVLISVVISCFILYCIISFFGYFYSFKYTCGNILLNYRQDDPVVTFGRLCLGFVILFTFPLLILPARTSLHNILNQIFNCQSMNLNKETHSENEEILNGIDGDNDNISENDTTMTNSVDIDTKTSLLKYQQIVNNNEIQKVKTEQNSQNGSIDWQQSLDGVSINYSLISDVGVIDDGEKNKKKKNGKMKRSSNNFTTRSFSNTDSPLRLATDALGVINEPNDILLLQDQEFVKRFKNLDGSINYEPSKLFLILETTFMICSSLLVSFLTESVMVLWGLMGSTVGFIIAFTLPGVFYFKIRYHKGWTRRNVGSLIIAVLSCFAIILCTWQALVRLNAETCPIRPN